MRENMNSIGLRDILYNIILGIMALVMMANFEVSKKTDENTAKTPGNFIVTMTWPNDKNDVDLWIRGPSERQSIGFSNKSGKVWNLLRDDRGTDTDITGMNYENAYSRGTPPGEYIVNVKCYSCNNVPVKVKVEIQLNKMDGSATIQVAEGEITFDSSSQEITVARFIVDEKGNVDRDTMNRLPINLSAS